MNVPPIIYAKRKRSIAAGSGIRVEDVNNRLKQLDMMQKMMKQMGGGKFGKGKKPRIPMSMLKDLKNMGGMM